MADTDPVNFSMGAARQIRDVVRTVQRMPGNERGRGRRWPIPEDGGGTSTDFNTGSGYCGCCNPSNCADYPIPLSGCAACDSGPREWSINFGNMGTGLCTNFSGTMHLEYVSYCIYQSATFQCPGAAAVNGCGAAASCCNGQMTIYTYTSLDGWTADSSACPAGCTAGSAPACNLDPDTGLEYADGSTLLRPCLGDTYDLYGWVGSAWVLGAGETGCSTPPTEVIYSGCPAGETYAAPCCSDALEGDQYSYLELSLSSSRDGDNRSLTTLSLMIGGIAAITWHLPIGKDWCCTCENKMELKCCGPYGFSNVPETLCVAPLDFDSTDLYVDPGAGLGDCCVLNDDGKVPRYFTFSAGLADDAFLLPCCSETASGDFIVEFDQAAGYWTFTIEEDLCLGDCDDDSTGNGHKTMSSWKLICSGGGFALGLYVTEYETGTCPPEIGVGSERLVSSWSLSAPLANCNAPEGLALVNPSYLTDECVGPNVLTVRPIV